jgi:Bacterial Ig-like domain (group 3)
LNLAVVAAKRKALTGICRAGTLWGLSMHLSSRRPLTAAAVLLGLGLSVQAQAGGAGIVGVNVAASPSPAMFGQQVTLTATVSDLLGCPDPTGTVTFENGIAQIGSPVTLIPGAPSIATLQITLPAGENSISAVYNGGCIAGSVGPSFTEDIIGAPTVPTLAEWGKIGFAGLLLLSGVGFLARRARNNGAR